MLIWDDAITLAKWQAVNTESETETMAKLLMNMGYKEILSRFRRDQNTDIQTASTVAAQRSYMLPPNFLRIISVNYSASSVLTPVVHVQNEEIWDNFVEYGRSSSRPERFFLRHRFGHGGAELLLDPIPSAVGTLQITYEATDRDLAVLKYTAGSVSITNGSAAVVGSSTVFTANMVGRYLNITGENGDGMWYRIGSYTDATHITLENVYEGATVTTNAYQIAEAFAVPEEMQILPVYYFLWHFFSRAQNEKKIAEFAGLYQGGIKRAQQEYNSKDDSNRVFNAGKYRQGAWPVYPGHFPQQVS